MSAGPVSIPRRWPRRAAYAGAAGLALLLPTSTAGAVWYMAAQVLNAGGTRQYPVRVRDASPGRVTLTRTLDTARQLPLAFVWPSGHARLGPVLDVDRATVVREVEDVTRGTLLAGIRGYTTGYLFEGDPRTARDLPFEDVTVPGELGNLPAWLVPPVAGASDDTWIIAVHGRGAPRGEALRILPTLAQSGHTTLVITYRNDVEAPASPDRRFHLGNAEWRDVLAAVQYAQRQGAKHVILYGWSMGGAAVLTLMRRWRHGGLVRGLVLDCPVVDWTETLKLKARAMNVPAAWTWTALRLIERRLDLRLADLDHRTFAKSLDVSALVIVDHDDATVAPRPTLEFAEAAPDRVTLFETWGAGHCRSWNLDPDGYENAVRSYLKAL